MPPKEIRQLGSGGMGEVWLAEDPERGTVALKKIREEFCREDSLARFRAEFASLTRLRHPHLVRAFEYFVDETSGRHAYTMEYVEGLDFTAATGGLTPLQVAALAEQVCDALDHVHGHDLVHGDIKPGNVLVREGVVKLMDFGLADHPGPHGLRGSLDYLAPEIIQGRPHDRRADLYSLGVVLFEALCRQTPFHGTSRFSILRAHLRSHPEFPARVRAPADLQRIVLRLLCKDPSARFFTAAEVAESLRALRGHRGRHALRPEALRTGTLAGRERALEALEGALRTAAAGAGPVVRVVSGAVGSGKSRLFRELRSRLGARRALCASANCPRNPPPFGPVLEWIDALASHSGPDWARFRAARTLVAAAAPGAASRAAEILDAASRRAPIALILENADWADHASLELVAALRLRRHARILLIASVTPGEGRARWEDADAISLGPLDAEQISDLAASMTGASAVETRLSRALARVTGGNPGAARACLRALAAEGHLFLDDGRLRATAPVAAPHGLERALEFLSTDSRVCLEALAVLEVARSEEDLALVSSLAPDRLAPALFDLESRHLLVREESLHGARFRLAAPALSNAVFAAAPADSVSTMHRSAATLPGNSPADNARHLFGSGGGPLAAAAAVAAARHARDAGAWADAALFLESALAEPHLPPTDARAASLALAEAREHLGQSELAASLYDSLIPTASTEEAVRLSLARARVLALTRPESALDALRAVPPSPESAFAATRALLRLGRSTEALRASAPAADSPRVGALRARALLAIGHSSEAHAQATRSADSLRLEDPAAACESFLTAAEAAADLRDTAATAAAADAAAETAARAASVPGQLDALLARARLLALRDDRWASLAALRDAAQAARGLDHDSALARARISAAHLLLEAGRWDDAWDASSEALDAARRSGEVLLQVEALLPAARVRLDLGALAEADAFASRAIELATLGGPSRPLGRARALRASIRLAQGRPEEARSDDGEAHLAWPGTADPLFAAEYYLSGDGVTEVLELLPGIVSADPRDAARLHFIRGTALLRVGDPSGATAAIDEFYELLARARAIRDTVLLRRAHHGLARAMQALHLDRSARDHFRRALEVLRDEIVHVPADQRHHFLCQSEILSLRQEILAMGEPIG